MKKIHLFITLFFLSFLGFSQNVPVDSRLKSYYSEKELSLMQTKNPQDLEYLNFYVANAYQVTPLPSGKGDAHEIKGSVKVNDIKNVNIYELKLFPLQKDYQYYKIEGTDKLLVIISEEQLRALFKQSKK